MFTPNSARRVHLLRRLRRLERFNGTYWARKEKFARRMREPGTTVSAYYRLVDLDIRSRATFCALLSEIIAIENDLGLSTAGSS